MFGSPETQKAYELSYATFRVAALVRRQDLKERLERQAAIILERVASGDLAIGEPLETLRALIMLSEGIGEIRYINAKVLLRELGNLERMVKDRAVTKEGGEELDVERMFSTTATGKAGVEDSIRRIQERREAEAEETLAGQAVRHTPKVDPTSSPQANSAKQEMRQNGNGNGEAHPSPNSSGGQARAAAIYAKIQLGNVSIKDLLAEFGSTSSPLGGASERTLRYDLQRLVEQGKIERVGNGGPGTFYRSKKTDSTSSPQAEVPLIAETALHNS